MTGPPPDFIRQNFQVAEGPIDRWLHVHWQAPAYMALYAGGVASGQPKKQGIVSTQAHWFTPETATSSHYFYAAGVPKSLGPDAEMIAKETVVALAQPFEFEDKPIIEAQQQNLCGRDIADYGGVILDIDAAGVHARRILAKLLATEAE